MTIGLQHDAGADEQHKRDRRDGHEPADGLRPAGQLVVSVAERREVDEVEHDHNLKRKGARPGLTLIRKTRSSASDQSDEEKKSHNEDERSDDLPANEPVNADAQATHFLNVVTNFISA